MDIQNPVFRFEHLQNAASHSFTLGRVPSVFFLPWLAKEMTKDEAIAAHGGPLHLPSNMGVLPVPAFASCGSERGICGLVTSILLFEFCRQFSSGRHFVEVITFDAEAFLQTLKTIEACRLHGIPG